MKKFLSILCITSLLVSGITGIPVIAAESENICEETTDKERASWYLSYYNTYVSNYNGSLCVNINTRATESMEKIGVKDLISIAMMELVGITNGMLVIFWLIIPMGIALIITLWLWIEMGVIIVFLVHIMLKNLF